MKIERSGKVEITEGNVDVSFFDFDAEGGHRPSERELLVETYEWVKLQFEAAIASAPTTPMP